jgi:hypothetical protein
LIAMKKVVAQFVKVFDSVIRLEMDAMRERMGPYEVVVNEGRRLESSVDGEREEYSFAVPVPNEKLVLNSECRLAHDDGEVLVTIIELDGNSVTVRCDHPIRMDSSSYALVIYPWFLYEKLLNVLGALPESTTFCDESALRIFGKLKPVFARELRRGRPLSGADESEALSNDLNESQNRAIQLCQDSNVAFVWGPPGTGKTTTLGHIVTELLAKNYRVLVTSTTNAAVDQALAKLAELDAAKEYLAEGRIVRVGQTSAETFGASPREIARKRHEKLNREVGGLRKRRDDALSRIMKCGELLDSLSADDQGHQMDMFSGSAEQLLARSDLDKVFSPMLSAHVFELSAESQKEVIETRRTRLRLVKELCHETVERTIDELRDKEGSIVQDARVVLATMTNVYISQLLEDERFDVVIIEEAGMAILPTLFYCAGMGSKKVIAIGDPRQLPPIVQSRDGQVHQSMGKNIFEITVPRPHESEIVVMLDTQYRMHPVIGTLVGDMFYDGQLVNAESTKERSSIAAMNPYPGQALTVLDTAGKTTCSTLEGSYSRQNEQTARMCVELAAEAVSDGVESIAIVTPYVQQSRLIRKLLSDERISGDRVECKTVHRFQGNERDMVIFDTVDTKPMKPGVLLAGSKGRTSAPNLINVSISRAKGKLIVVSDVGYFRSQAAGSAIDQMLAAAILAGDIKDWV